MKKVLLLAFVLLSFVSYQSQAAPVRIGFMTYQLPTSSIQSATTINEQGLMRLAVTNHQTGAVTTIYARLQYENEYVSGFGLYGDVIVRFWEDAEQEIPAYVTSLTVNFRVIGYNGYSGYDYYDAMTANGDYLVIASGAEHDYDDGETFRYRDYHLAAGDYVSL
jgi:hypothetical protein